VRFAARLTPFLLLLACGSQAPEPSPEASTGATGDVTFYEGTGTVTELLEDHVRIEHDEIRGFMDAMTMSFEVADPALLERLEAGMDVKFRVAVSGRSAVIDRIDPGERPR
jgi:Cu/Ag efflux protein CusF